ncbi:hypothetical protein Ga0100231_019800 [Opitutaceae bacterium TAV4]|nr:hypothetical protein Ga0100231_019800 [Opitutaceae bacterium TAV4]RRK00311.1 hypothetical protein Ga0100230_020560 [Opitutaceae bacterium TAV3]
MPCSADWEVCWPSFSSGISTGSPHISHFASRNGTACDVGASLATERGNAEMARLQGAVWSVAEDQTRPGARAAGGLVCNPRIPFDASSCRRGRRKRRPYLRQAPHARNIL